MLTDTASVSSLTAIVAARHALAGLDSKEQGLAGRSEVPRLRLYCSAEAHSSIDKAAIVAGIGRAGVRRIATDSDFRMRPEALARAIAEDRAAGWRPLGVVGTIGTTSSTSVDPIDAVADICAREGLWLHVDAAYGGAAALAPELRSLLRGWERADSIVVNPHKWMFTPFDASLLLFRRPEAFRDAFSLVPEYLRTPDQGEVRNYHEYGIQLGRRFRALKLWFLLRYFGAEGMAARVREHCRLAQLFGQWIDAEPDWQRLAPIPFSTVCFRHCPHTLDGHEGDPARAQALELHNEAILAEVNRSGRIYLSHTKLQDRYTIRVTLGNLRAGEEHVRQCWALLQQAARTVGGSALHQPAHRVAW
jgi:aromatic-L-amino-acid decarboxylase